jgi:putative PIN family toxin of toxin-antitoxin system
VLDTNVIVSGTIGNSGSPFIILEAWRKGRFILITSQTLIDEVERVFRYPRIQKKYHITEKQVTNVIKNLINYSIATPRNIKLSVITKDPPDNEVLIAALEGEADYIVTGDADLLELKSYKGIKIVLPSEFVELLGEN